MICKSKGRPKRIHPERRTKAYKHDHRKRVLLPKQTINLYEYVQRDNHTYFMFEYDKFECIIARTDDGGLIQGYYGFFFKLSDTFYYNNLETRKPTLTIQKALNNIILDITNVTHTRLKYKSIGNVKYKII